MKLLSTLALALGVASLVAFTMIDSASAWNKAPRVCQGKNGKYRC
jgi:hypothetical protein